MELEKLRHSASHILAGAVKELYPEVKLGIGPSIEDGFYYDFDNLDIKEEDLKKIELRMQEIVNRGEKFKKLKKTIKEAEKLLKEETYKLELLRDLEDKDITFYQNGDFIDLCKGPHVKSSKEVKAFKLLRIAGAYWKGNARNKMLTRIYGTAFPSQKELEDYLKLREEAEKRNHIKLGKELDLFSIHEEGHGFIFWHPRGIILWNELMRFWKEKHDKAGYVEIKTPIILSRDLWERSGHWDYYRENMYTLTIDDYDYAIKPMNCPGGMLWYKEKLHSYREFPLRVAEIGLVHRHELSGVLNGLFRVRSLHQDDAHIFMTEEQIKDEVLRIIKLTEEMYKAFNLDYNLELSTRPKKSVGTDEQWNKAIKGLKAALNSTKRKYKINEGEGAFYGPKIDFHVKDSLGRTWQCATIQLDMSLPERFDLTYEGKDGRKHRPVMIHRTLYGTMERFIGVLIEHYGGRFPLWLNPLQIKILTVATRNNKFAYNVKKELEEEGFRVDVDDRSESIAKKVRDSQIFRPNYVITIGDKEMKNKTLAVRDRNNKVRFGVKVKTFINDLIKERDKKK